MKDRKAITLISLIITVIVIFIIACVGINIAMDKDALFDKTVQAGENWNEAQKLEREDIEHALNLINHI